MPVTEKKPAAGWVAFVGAGPGDEGLLTVRAAQLLAEADLVVTGPEIGDRLAHLFGGDPFMFCNAAAEAAACAKAKVPFEIVPGVSAATAIPAYAGIPLTSDSSGEVR